MSLVFDDMLRTHVLIWIDDILLYARSPREFVTPFRRCFARVRQLGLKLNGVKSSLLHKDTRWCARPLHDQLEAVLKVMGRTKRLTAGAATVWATQDTSIVLISDASDRGLGLLVTKVRNWVGVVSVTEQHHDLLVGKFDETAWRWSIIEKEAYPTICATRNLTYLLVRGNGFHLYWDLINLIYASFRRGGWVTKCKVITCSSNCEPIAADKQIQQLILLTSDFVFPTLLKIQAAQQKHARVAPAGANVDMNNPY
ncbi:LOW QUALITY PROTEIN: hypothetical protein PHMEG_00010361 [Phytophthora megakarya]|uniref:Uncharacterized protein n=1 Tax=Phytophthora megakarya TaxID=4795 RepID=A0A225WDV3_9STRA|nr:LOW QUALITY PROTEIN: hypothetical protein PHMEG_00010361 [Phytophthora megakarya]